MTDARFVCRVNFLFQPRREAVAHGVFGAAAGLDEVQQVIGAAGLAADAREAEAAERLAADQRAGDAAVEIQVADAELAAGRPPGGPACG